MRDDLHKEGYDKEEEYFHRKDKELIQKLREKAQVQREKAETDNQKQQYWMRCPKCGSNLVEEKHEHVLVDRCTSCNGIYFDAGELEILLKAKSSLLSRIFGK